MGVALPSSLPRSMLRAVNWSIPCFLVTLFLVMLCAGPSQAQDFRLEKLWEMGAPDGPPETVWMRIADATVLDGRVYAVDVALPTVRGFTVDGEYLGELGAEGSGPGDFARPISATVLRDSLWVYDFALDRYTVFDASGRDERTMRTNPGLDAGALGYLGRVWPGRHGWWFGETMLVGRSRPSHSITHHRLLAWRTADAVDTVAVYDGNAFWRRSRGEDSLSIQTNAAVNPGPDGGAWVMSDSLLIEVDGEDSVLRVHRIEEGGPTLMEALGLPGAPRPVTPAEREMASRWYYRFYGVEQGESDVLEVIPPETWPAWTKVVGDDRGGVWIRQGGPRRMDPAEGERWARVSLEGGSLRWIELPPGVEALRFREGYMVGKRRGDFGVESLVLYRVTEL